MYLDLNRNLIKLSLKQDPKGKLLFGMGQLGFNQYFIIYIYVFFWLAHTCISAVVPVLSLISGTSTHKTRYFPVESRERQVEGQNGIQLPRRSFAEPQISRFSDFSCHTVASSSLKFADRPKVERL